MSEKRSTLPMVLLGGGALLLILRGARGGAAPWWYDPVTGQYSQTRTSPRMVPVSRAQALAAPQSDPLTQAGRQIATAGITSGAGWLAGQIRSWFQAPGQPSIGLPSTTTPNAGFVELAPPDYSIGFEQPGGDALPLAEPVPSDSNVIGEIPVSEMDYSLGLELDPTTYYGSP